MCKVSIPFESKTNRNEALRRCIEFASAHSGVDDFTVARVMSLFLEQIADENSRGRPVMIPGFGLFTPYPDVRAFKRGGPKRCRVRFYPAMGYSQQVLYGSAPLPQLKSQWKVYIKNHAPHVGRTSKKRVFTSMKAFRDRLDAQMAAARG